MIEPTDQYRVVVLLRRQLGETMTGCETKWAFGSDAIDGGNNKVRFCHDIPL